MEYLIVKLILIVLQVFPLSGIQMHFFYDTHDAWLLGFCGLFLFKALMTRLQEMCITNDMHISNVYCDRAEKVIISLFFQTNSKS
jgi:hypothetical protein